MSFTERGMRTTCKLEPVSSEPILVRRWCFVQRRNDNMRVCSFLPSGTEILFALGLADSVMGVTFECDTQDPC